MPATYREGRNPPPPKSLREKFRGKSIPKGAISKGTSFSGSQRNDPDSAEGTLAKSLSTILLVRKWRRITGWKKAVYVSKGF